MNLPGLSSTIGEIDHSLSQAANRAVNSLLTARNWLIGFYIVEYEDAGEDRAKYGENITQELANQLDRRGLSARNLWLFRQFYLAYPKIGLALSEHPRIVHTLSALSRELPKESDNESVVIVRSAIAESENIGERASGKILQSPIAELGRSTNWHSILETLHDLHVPGEKLLEKLSYTHLSLLLPIEDPLKRTFYEIEAIKGTWSVRELKRQISSLYFERSGLSADPEKLSQLTQEKLTPSKPAHLTKDLYTFEFLGLPGHVAVEESDLETGLLDHLQEFLPQTRTQFPLIMPAVPYTLA